MLDTGHLLNTNLDINTEEEVIDYLIEMINPKFLVYEFITTSLEELTNFIKIQNKALDL